MVSIHKAERRLGASVHYQQCAEQVMDILVTQGAVG